MKSQEESGHGEKKIYALLKELGIEDWQFERILESYPLCQQLSDDAEGDASQLMKLRQCLGQMKRDGKFKEMSRAAQLDF